MRCKKCDRKLKENLTGIKTCPCNHGDMPKPGLPVDCEECGAVAMKPCRRLVDGSLTVPHAARRRAARAAGVPC